MPSFLESRMDTKITAGATGGPSVPGRTKSYLSSGKLQQTWLSSLPIHKYDVSHGVRNRADFQKVLDLWYVVNFGPYTGFRFKDWRDYQGNATNTALTLTDDGWQLQRKHVFGSATFLRDIYKPVNGVVVYAIEGTTLTGTVDTTTGLFEPDSGNPGYWVGEFDVPVTFTDDEWTASYEVNDVDLWLQSGTIKLEEIRL